MEEILRVRTSKKGWPSLSSTSTTTTSAAVLFVGGCMIMTIGINQLFASPSLQILDIADKNTDPHVASKTSYDNTGQYTNANNTQDWKDTENNVKIHFTYLPEYPLPGNTTKLIFHVQNLQTGNYLKNLVASITITNNLTTAKIDGIKDTNGAFSRFTNIPGASGIFSLNYRFLEEGTHQVIVNIRSENFSLALASFSVVVQPII
ncbi:MAG TPA: hypothetical protein VE971_00915 [Candidatus Eisenbacteria bacterium]|nr:hypothetical protein [Candidatus Eisenbacteria bacterium]